MPRIAITMGDPAGVGPELCCRVAADPAVTAVCTPVIVGSTALLMRVASQLGLPVPTTIDEPEDLALDAVAVVPGEIQAANGAAALASIEHAIAGCRDGSYAAMVTAPISKRAIAAAGCPHPGHTELLAERCPSDDGLGAEATMLLYDQILAVALVTVHRSLRSVPEALTIDGVVTTGRRLATALERIRGAAPRIAVLGLNPHAGEGRLFGDEDERIVAPAVARLRELGIDADGPLPPDTAFTPAGRARYDGHVCLYHDQGLIPFKALAFDAGVNVSLGLPIVRTSPDHGTAYDIAWSGVADPGSLRSAVLLATRLAAAE